MLVVNNSKNPAHDTKSSAKYSKVGEEAGSCCNHGKNPGEVEGGVGCSCVFALASSGGDYDGIKFSKPTYQEAGWEHFETYRSIDNSAVVTFVISEQP